MTEWKLIATVTDGVSNTVPATSGATLAFGSGVPKAFVNTGCNVGSGAVETGDTVITFGPMAITRRACADEAGNVLEARILATLNGQVGYQIVGKRLTLTKGSTSLVYQGP